MIACRISFLIATSVAVGPLPNVQDYSGCGRSGRVTIFIPPDMSEVTLGHLLERARKTIPSTIDLVLLPNDPHALSEERLIALIQETQKSLPEANFRLATKEELELLSQLRIRSLPAFIARDARGRTHTWEGAGSWEEILTCDK